MPADGERLKIDYQRLKAGSESRGIGGVSKNYSEKAILAFTEPKRRIVDYVIDLQIARPSRENLDIPSLLGRDILDNWLMSYNAVRKRLSFRILKAGYTAEIG